MITPCSPIMHYVAFHTFHRLAHGLRHASHRVWCGTQAGLSMVRPERRSPRFTASFACKMGSAAIIAGGLLTGLPTNTPLSPDKVTNSGDGASRSSTTPSETSGALDQSSSRIWVVGLGNAPALQAIAPTRSATYHDWQRFRLSGPVRNSWPTVGGSLGGRAGFDTGPERVAA